MRANISKIVWALPIFSIGGHFFKNTQWPRYSKFNFWNASFFAAIDTIVGSTENNTEINYVETKISEVYYLWT